VNAALPARSQPTSGFLEVSGPAYGGAAGAGHLYQCYLDNIAQLSGGGSNTPVKSLPFLYRDRNAIERMFGRLKEFRRIATRYDRSATNVLSAVCLAATVSYWL